MTGRHQTLWLTLVSVACVVPSLFKTGTNVVTHTYATAARRMWAGISPYLPPPAGADWHKCSPFFALLYSPFALLPPVPQALAWAALNAFVFWLGVSRWCRLGARSSLWLWAMFLAASMELDGSLRYQQTNALLIGLVLLALADFRDGRETRAGFDLAVATDLKLLPAAFFVPLAVPWRPAYTRGAMLGLAVALLLPAVVVGPAKDLAFHRDWVRILSTDLGSRGLLDLETTLTDLGAGRGLAHGARVAVIAITAALLLLARRIGELRFPWHVWIAVGSYGVLLASPRTESPTFVYAAPAYILLALAFLGETKRPAARAAGLAALAAGYFFVTLSFNDVWPKGIWHPGRYHYATKTLGVLGLWAVSAAWLARQIRTGRRI